MEIDEPFRQDVVCPLTHHFTEKLPSLHSKLIWRGIRWKGFHLV